MQRIILISLLVAGCATGETTEPPVVTSPEIVEPQRPAPVQDKPEKPGPSCEIIRTIWGGNCRLDEYLCPDGSYKLDGKCYPPDWTPPWENLPDPPPPYKE